MDVQTSITPHRVLNDRETSLYNGSTTAPPAAGQVYVQSTYNCVQIAVNHGIAQNVDGNQSNLESKR